MRLSGTSGTPCQCRGQERRLRSAAAGWHSTTRPALFWHVTTRRVARARDSHLRIPRGRGLSIDAATADARGDRARLRGRAAGTVRHPGLGSCWEWSGREDLNRRVPHHGSSCRNGSPPRSITRPSVNSQGTGSPPGVSDGCPSTFPRKSANAADVSSARHILVVGPERSASQPGPSRRPRRRLDVPASTPTHRTRTTRGSRRGSGSAAPVYSSVVGSNTLWIGCASQCSRTWKRSSTP